MKSSRHTFRLRTLLVIMALSALPLAWVAYSLEWIRQRNEPGRIRLSFLADDNRRLWKNAPCGLWIFGEHGYARLAVFRLPAEAVPIDKLRRLFPEAEFREYVTPDEEHDDMTNCVATYPPLRP